MLLEGDTDLLGCVLLVGEVVVLVGLVLVGVVLLGEAFEPLGTRFVVVERGCVVVFDLEGLVLWAGVVLRVLDLVVLLGVVVVLVFGAVDCCGV